MDTEEPPWPRADVRPYLQVFFVDYGNKSHVALDLLMEIPSQLLELPFQVGGLPATPPIGPLLFAVRVSLWAFLPVLVVELNGRFHSWYRFLVLLKPGNFWRLETDRRLSVRRSRPPAPALLLRSEPRPLPGSLAQLGCFFKYIFY